MPSGLAGEGLEAMSGGVRVCRGFRRQEPPGLGILLDLMGNAVPPSLQP